MGLTTFILTAGIIAALMVLRADLRRRRLTLTRGNGWHLLTMLDVACTAVTIGISAGLLVALIPAATLQWAIPLRSPVTLGMLASSAAFAFLWKEGLRQVQFQRPRGILVAEWLIVASAYVLIEAALFREFPAPSYASLAKVLPVLAMLTGCLLLARIVPPFLKKGAEYHRILDHLQNRGDSIQQEYTPATPECPNPKLWHMVDSQSTELEVLDLLKSLVITLKPRLVVETGTFLGYGAIRLAEGLRANGFGKLITVEFDPVIFAKAKERIAASGLSEWVECRNESSLDSRIEGSIDFYFSDSGLQAREREVRRLLPQVDPRGLIAIHDASSHFTVVREAALRMENEGLISVVFLSTPRGLVLAQKREGRK